MTIKRILILFALVILSLAAIACTAGCGSTTGTTMVSQNFNNQTNGAATDAQLMSLWQYAQQQLVPRRRMAALRLTSSPTRVTPGCWPCGPQALSIQPDGLTVETAPPPYDTEAGPFNGAFRCIGNTDSPSGWCDAETVEREQDRCSAVATPGSTDDRLRNGKCNSAMRQGYDVSGR